MDRPSILYRLTTQTVAVPLDVSHPVALFIPPGSLLRARLTQEDDEALVEVEWEGRRIQMFAVDLRERGEMVEGRGAD